MIDKFYLMFPEFTVRRFDMARAKKDFAKLNDMTDAIASWFTNSDLSEAFDENPQEFNEWFEEHKNEYRLHRPKIKYINYNYKKSVRENSVKQRNNQIINMIWGILTNPDTVSKQLNPGNFDKAKAAARICNIALNANYRELIDALGVDSVDQCYSKLESLSLKELNKLSEQFLGVFDPLSPVTQMFFHDQNATGGKMIGIYANNNSNHALIQHTKLACIPFTMNGVEYSSLHSMKNDRGNFITRNISNFLAASVDNVKDPVLRDLMQNPTTGNIACLMLRAGVEPNEVGLFLNQPIVKDIINELNKNEYKDRKKIIKEVVNRWALKRTWKTPADKADRYKNLYSNDMFNAILFEKEMSHEIENNPTSGQKGWYNFQLYVGNAFSGMYETAEELADLTNIMRADTSNGSSGPGIADTYQKINRITRFISKLDSPTSRLINADFIQFRTPAEGEDIYDSCIGSVLPFVTAFTVAGIGGNMRLMSKYFPFFNSSIYNMLFNEEYGLSNFVSEGKTSADLINTVLNDLMVYTISKTDFFGTYTDSNGVHRGIENRRKFIINFPSEFQRIVSNNPDIAENRFVSRLRVKYNKKRNRKEVPVATLQFRNSGKLSTIQRDMYSRDWLSLLYSDNPKAVELGLNLFKYASFMGGFGFGPNSFIHMAPVLLRKAVPGYEQTLRDLTKRDDYSPFIRQFIMNHMDMKSIVPVYSGKDLNSFTFSDGKKKFETPYTNSSLIRETVTDENMRVINKITPFINVMDASGNSTYYEADSWEVPDGQPFKYHKVQPLGFRGKVLEYEYGAADVDSVFYSSKRLNDENIKSEPIVYGDEMLNTPTPAPYSSSLRLVSDEGIESGRIPDIGDYVPFIDEDANGNISCGI